MPRYPRPSSASPTVPPPQPPEPFVERVTRRVKPWQVLVGIAVALFVAGGTFAIWRADLATHGDLTHERERAAGPVISLQVEASAMRDRMTHMETAYADMKATLDDTRHGVQFLTEQLIEIAKSTHARQIPPPDVVTSQGGP